MRALVICAKSYPFSQLVPTNVWAGIQSAFGS